MIISKWFRNRLFIHVLGLLALVTVHFISDYNHFLLREGFNKYSPYIFLILMYGWIVFHNLVLFDGLFLKGKRKEYFKWTSLAIVLSSINIFFIMRYGFNSNNPFPQIVNFLIFTILGLGLYIIYRYITEINLIEKPQIITGNEATPFLFNDQALFQKDILYIESLENYIKVHTQNKVHVVRMTLKEAEKRLYANYFVRISRYHIVNKNEIKLIEQDNIHVKSASLKIGKTYKKYVLEHLKRD